MMIRECNVSDFACILAVINDAARAYRGVIPEDRLRDPYMSADELLGVMGSQPVADVTLIRHAFVRSEHQNRGIGGRLLNHLLSRTECPVLIGTWSAAHWAIRFYEKYGFEVIEASEKDRLLRRYLSIPDRQIATSVVLADAKWRARR